MGLGQGRSSVTHCNSRSSKRRYIYRDRKRVLYKQVVGHL